MIPDRGSVERPDLDSSYDMYDSRAAIAIVAKSGGNGIRRQHTCHTLADVMECRELRARVSEVNLLALYRRTAILSLRSCLLSLCCRRYTCSSEHRQRSRFT